MKNKIPEININSNTSLVFQRWRCDGKLSALGKLSKLSGSLMGSPSGKVKQTHHIILHHITTHTYIYLYRYMSSIFSSFFWKTSFDLFSTNFTTTKRLTQAIPTFRNPLATKSSPSMDSRNEEIHMPLVLFCIRSTHK